MARSPRLPAYFTRVVPPDEQARGSFDQGAIVEQKMIGFAGEGSAIHRIGPLYYWAWARADKASTVEPHPHRGFEILSYVLEGAIEHRDSLGHRSQVGAGGMQLMQTGSGIEHEELFVTTPAESFQIWLDPHFRKQTEVAPTYRAFTVNEFVQDGPERILLGVRSPVHLETPDVEMRDVTLESGASVQGMVPAGSGWAAIVLKGKATIAMGESSYAVQARDFFVHQGAEDAPWVLSATDALRVLWMQVPLTLPYPLFPKPR